ncbi:sorting nexin-31 isoform X2 [Apodemus sylvaticus]|uniref:sorting nexin-31 isoform X2 n=1 Tax=Apodemus sylvaticus TaxID=10129 RepID=UPI0022437811|nr:sorting nexin-31 isoform X2 [Apodemus sylvaticus]
MKMHFCIPVSQQLPDALGGRYVLYSVYLDGFLFCKARYSQLHRWDEQLRRVFGNCLPPFPPKYYLAMTTAMAEERRDQLERYLQTVTADARVTRSDVFTEFLTLMQLQTLNISAQNVELAVFLPDGRSIKMEGLTSDTAERVLEVMAHKLGLHPELVGYFGLFLIRPFPEGKLSVVKKLADFELPYASLQSSEMENCKIGLRKWYLDPAVDSVLMDCSAARDLLYTQAVQDIEIEWMKPTQAQREELKALQKTENQTKFLELSQEVRHYGYIQLDPCTCNHPEPGCGVQLSMGNNEISCHITLPNGQTQDVAFQMSGVKCWQVTFLGTLLDTHRPQRTLNQNLELRFQYSEDSRQQWFVIYTKQAFFLSSCLKKMISEKMARLAEESPEMQIEVPEQGKKRRSQASQKDYFNFLRKGKMKKSEGDNVWDTLTEEGL